MNNDFEKYIHINPSKREKAKNRPIKVINLDNFKEKSNEKNAKK